MQHKQSATKAVLATLFAKRLLHADIAARALCALLLTPSQAQRECKHSEEMDGAQQATTAWFEIQFWGVNEKYCVFQNKFCVLIHMDPLKGVVTVTQHTSKKCGRWTSFEKEKTKRRLVCTPKSEPKVSKKNNCNGEVAAASVKSHFGCAMSPR
jgi:hypothetical protein